MKWQQHIIGWIRYLARILWKFLVDKASAPNNQQKGGTSLSVSLNPSFKVEQPKKMVCRKQNCWGRHLLTSGLVESEPRLWGGDYQLWGANPLHLHTPHLGDLYSSVHLSLSLYTSHPPMQSPPIVIATFSKSFKTNKFQAQSLTQYWFCPAITRT